MNLGCKPDTYMCFLIPRKKRANKILMYDFLYACLTTRWDVSEKSNEYSIGRSFVFAPINE